MRFEVWLVKAELVVVIGILVVRAVVPEVFPRELVVRGGVVAEALVVSVPVAMDGEVVKFMLVLAVVSMTVVVVVQVGVVRDWVAVWVVMVVDWIVVSLRPDVIFLEGFFLLS